MRLLPCLALLACAPADDPSGTTPIDTAPVATDTATTPTDTAPPRGACGEITVWDLWLKGKVLDRTGRPALGASVRLEDRGWAPVTVLGTTTTDAQGLFELPITGLTSVEDCWATLLDYVAVAERGTEVGEADVNTELFNAIQSGTLVADRTLFPIEMEDTAR